MTAKVIHPLRRAAGWIARRCTRRGLILLYHRVAQLECDANGLCVSPGHFAEQMEVLRRRATPVSLREAASLASEGRLPRRAVAVTFDDGYRDVAEQALPVLRAHDIPATIFCTTGDGGRNREFWWDELERIVLRPGILPGELDLGLPGGTMLTGDAAELTAEECARHWRWAMRDGNPPTPRHRLLVELFKQIHPLDHRRRREAMDRLSGWAGDGGGVRDSHRVLCAAQVKDLSDGGLIEIGAHTVSHPMLTALASDEQQAEIRMSRVELESIVGKPVDSFAYPYGMYNAETVRGVHDAGFARACTCEERALTRRPAMLELPRFEVGDWDGERFEQSLESWLAP